MHTCSLLPAPLSVTAPPPSVLQGLISSHLSRLQLDLFHELKKVRKCDVKVSVLTLPLCSTPSTCPEWQLSLAGSGCGGVC